MARALGDLTEEVMVVGGSVVDLLLTDPASPNVRPTIDVDITFESHSITEYYNWEDRLRSLGFTQRADEPVICRWFGHGIILDLMPDDDAILGFANAWYRSAIRSSKSVALPSGRTIRVIDAPHFLATKLEALRSRGNGDLMSSHDFEDVVNLINGRAELVSEVAVAPESLRAFLRETLSSILADRRHLEAIEGALVVYQDSPSRASLVQGRIREIHSVLNS